jgi:hypothetical protein
MQVQDKVSSVSQLDSVQRLDAEQGKTLTHDHSGGFTEQQPRLFLFTTHYLSHTQDHHRTHRIQEGKQVHHSKKFAAH